MRIPIKTNLNGSIFPASNLPNNQTLTPRPRIRTNIKTEWKKVEAISKTLLTPDAGTDRKSTVHRELKLKPKQELRKISISEVINEIKYDKNDATEDKKETQLDRIERKMDEILDRLERQETALLHMKKDIFDISSATKSSVVELDENEERPVKPAKRKCLVVFPVADDDYLLRLEELVSSDEDIMEDLISLYKTAPVNSAYDFLRFNINALFKNCSKYTWTGKPPNSCPTALPSKAAGSLCLIDHLIRCAAETFPHVNRDLIQKDLRRALANFNESKTKRMSRHQELGLIDVFKTVDYGE
ncbi:uncharacterized protein LOC134212884 isoform X2 [Armigeres subalbatus]